MSIFEIPQNIFSTKYFNQNIKLTLNEVERNEYYKNERFLLCKTYFIHFSIWNLLNQSLKTKWNIFKFWIPIMTGYISFKNAQQIRQIDMAMKYPTLLNLN